MSGAARRFTALRSRRHTIDPEIIDIATLLVSELATNAIVHATSTIRLRVRVGEDIRVEVRDASDDAPGHRRLARWSGSGAEDWRIVSTLADELGLVPETEGKVVWFAWLAAHVRRERSSGRTRRPPSACLDGLRPTAPVDPAG